MISAGDINVRDLKRFENMLGALGAEAPKAVNRAINRAGDMARTQVVKALSTQTGLSQKLIRKAVKHKRYSWGKLEYQLNSAGGDVSLKYFKKRETRDGVVAQLGNVRGNDWFAEAFFRGGAFPGRRVEARKLNGHVFVRRGGRGDLELVRSGVVIPDEMISGASVKAFEDSVETNLSRRLEHEISRALGV